MKTFVLSLMMILLAISSGLSAGSWSKKLTQQEIANLEELRESAMADDQILIEQQNILSEYVSETSRYENSLPIDQKAMESIVEKHSEFVEGPLEVAKEQLQDMIEKYEVKDAKALESILRNRINPEQATGLPLSFGFKNYQMNRSIKIINERTELFNKGLAKAESIAEETAQANVKNAILFPENSFDGDGDLADLQQQAKAALVSGKISDSDMLNVAITSGWTNGIFPVTKIPFRTIRGSVLFKDTDDDGLCRFNGYTFISVDGAALEYKAVRGGGDGYADCDKGASANGGLESSGGFFSSLTWSLLVLINLVAGIIILKEKFKGYEFVKNLIAQAESYNIMIGLAAIALGAWGFTMEFLSLNLLSNILPQASAVLVGTLLSAQFLMSKKEEVGEQIAKIQPFTQTLGMAAIGIGLAHLVFSGGLYFV